jgi:hypothetical protein
MADIYVWLRYSSARLLTWQRNYNTQPRILSAAQVRVLRGGSQGFHFIPRGRAACVGPRCARLSRHAALVATPRRKLTPRLHATPRAACAAPTDGGGARAHAQSRLTERIASAHARTSGEAQEWVRLMLTTVGRGGDGQRIRDEILHIMHRCTARACARARACASVVLCLVWRGTSTCWACVWCTVQARGSMAFAALTVSCSP